ncbi:hypothetical protein IW261DRAFT_1418019 [Armillaria novae-zelandiae]|uniref:Uncharacterized protein n=1 Tax=Armillaria novae-zelandiae TaxID=153914 RepID=A0AA39TDW8_9AGAR|nr:hypothetical protein IW261DRAFT_1418019 [Armillaria novae-zelandiae]
MPLDVELSDIEIQNWLDDDLNSRLLKFFVHGFILGWIKLSRAYVFATSSQARPGYNLANSSSVLLDTVGYTTSGLNLVIADCTVVWRCWVVWGCNRKVIILPIFFVMGGIVCGINDVVDIMIAGAKDETHEIWALATMATTLGTNLTGTALIVGRILYVARRQRGIMGGIRTYLGVLEILVESAALYSITFVVLMILYPLEGNGYLYPQALCFPVTGIAPTLIVLRVASGQGHPNESSLETQSSLHFDTSRGSTIESTTDEGEVDTMRGSTGGSVPVHFGSVEQV